jgi:hypothetical protein
MSSVQKKGKNRWQRMQDKEAGKTLDRWLKSRKKRAMA